MLRLPAVHNSGWVQSPGTAALEDASQYPRLEAYVKGIVGAFANDKRILGWDIWNEPDNDGGGSYAKFEAPNKTALVLALLPQAFAWAREAGATQPLTSGRLEWQLVFSRKTEPDGKNSNPRIRRDFISQLQQARRF